MDNICEVPVSRSEEKKKFSLYFPVGDDVMCMKNRKISLC